MTKASCFRSSRPTPGDGPPCRYPIQASVPRVSHPVILFRICKYAPWGIIFDRLERTGSIIVSCTSWQSCISIRPCLQNGQCAQRRGIFASNKVFFVAILCVLLRKTPQFWRDKTCHLGMSPVFKQGLELS